MTWYSIDGYNWGTTQSWSRWQSFTEVFTPAYNALSISSKPLFIAEFSSSEHGGNKAQWITDMFNDIPSKFPRIFALMWFNQSKSAEADWAVNTSDAALNAWKTGIAKIGNTKTAGDFRAVNRQSVWGNRSALSLGLSNSNSTVYDLRGRIIHNTKTPVLPSGIYMKTMPMHSH